MKEGWLLKQGFRKNSEKKRYFVLRGRDLFYFKGPSDFQPSGLIVIDAQVKVEAYEFGPNKSAKFGFRLNHPVRRTYYLRASNEEEYKTWIKLLGRAVTEGPEWDAKETAVDGSQRHNWSIAMLSQTPTLKEGWMYKKGSITRIWTKRWVVLKDGALFYFASAKDQRPKNVLFLDESAKIEETTIKSSSTTSSRAQTPRKKPSTPRSQFATTPRGANGSYYRLIVTSSSATGGPGNDSDPSSPSSSSSSSSSSTSASTHKFEAENEAERDLWAMLMRFASNIELPSGQKQKAEVYRRSSSGGSIGGASKIPAVIKNKSIQEIAFAQLTVEKKIGRGTFSKVYKAAWKDKIVAVKMFLVTNAMKTLEIDNFRREVELLASLKHPNIVTFHGACTRLPNLCIVTNYLPAGTVYDALRKSPCPIGSWSIKLKILAQTASAVSYLHSKQLLHRDIKAKNLLLTENFDTVLTDFGISRPISTYAASIVGTSTHMAPEVIHAEKYSYPVDTFSFGILLWELLTHSTPYKGLNPGQIGFRVVTKDLRPALPKPLPPTTPAGYIELMERCWSKDPKARPKFVELEKAIKSMSKSLPK